MVIDSSRNLYSQNRPEVEKLVGELHNPEPAPKPEKNKNKNNQKPRGNNNQHRSNGNNNHQSRSDHRPKQTEKSPEELRNILAQISVKENGKKSEDKKPERSEERKGDRHDPKPKVNNPEPKKENNLKEALADVLKQSGLKSDDTPAPPPARADREVPVENNVQKQSYADNQIEQSGPDINHIKKPTINWHVY